MASAFGLIGSPSLSIGGRPVWSFSPLGGRIANLHQPDVADEMAHIVAIVIDYDRATRLSLAGIFIGGRDIFVTKYARTSGGDSLRSATGDEKPPDRHSAFEQIIDSQAVCFSWIAIAPPSRPFIHVGPFRRRNSLRKVARESWAQSRRGILRGSTGRSARLGLRRCRMRLRGYT